MWTNSMTDANDRKRAISGLNNAYNLIIRNSNENLLNTPSIEHDERQAIFQLSTPKSKSADSPSGSVGGDGEEVDAGSKNLHQLISPRSSTRMKVLDRLVRGQTIFGLNEEKPSGQVLRRSSSSYLDIGHQHQPQKNLKSPNISEVNEKQQKQIETEIKLALEEIKASPQRRRPPSSPPAAPAAKEEKKKLLQLSECSSLLDFDILEDETLKKNESQFIRDHCSADAVDMTQIFTSCNSQAFLGGETPSEFEFPPQRPKIVPLQDSPSQTPPDEHADNDPSSSSSTDLTDDSDTDCQSHFEDEIETEHGALKGGNSAPKPNYDEIEGGSLSEGDDDRGLLTASQSSIDSTAPPAKKMKTRTSPEDEASSVDAEEDSGSEVDLKNTSVLSLKSDYSAELLFPPCPIVTSSIAFNPEDQKKLPVRQHDPIFHLDAALAQTLSLQSLQQIIPDPLDFMGEGDGGGGKDDGDGLILGTTAEWDHQARLRREEKAKRALKWRRIQYFATAFFLPIFLFIIYKFLL